MIIFTHHTGEPHGILGAQVAATFLQRTLSIPSIVVGIERDFSKGPLLRFIDEYYTGRWSPPGEPAPSIQHPFGKTSLVDRRERPAVGSDFGPPGERLVAFSHLCGREDIFGLAQELRQEGFVTILGGPQARQDYEGEPDTDAHPHRFRGLKAMVDIAFQGPVDGLRSEDLARKGVLLESPWTRNLFLETDWSNLYTFSDTLKKPEVRLAQVLNVIGCPYAVSRQTVTLPPPVSLRERGIPGLEVRSQGCTFCDVSWDKGYHGPVEHDKVLAQIAGLPEVDGRKVPFELIDEYPIRFLGKLIEDAERHGIRLSQINLVCRVDDINAHAAELPEILTLARDRDLKIMFSSIGFESFSDRLLQYFCKGITVADILRCVETLRLLKDRFGSHLLYRRDEGANHGFIRPTPWDDDETVQEMDSTIYLHRLFEDILPEHSTPLIIHHASHLGDWIREIESTTGITFGRTGTWIEWWNPSVA